MTSKSNLPRYPFWWMLAVATGLVTFSTGFQLWLGYVPPNRVLASILTDYFDIIFLTWIGWAWCRDEIRSSP